MTETDQSECRIVLGVAHLYAGEEDKVLKVLGAGHGAGQVPHLFREMVYYMRGVASLRLGQNKSGLEDINRSLVANPQSYRVGLCMYLLNVHVYVCELPTAGIPDKISSVCKRGQTG